MRFLQTLASYVPGIIVEQLMHGESLQVPFRKQYETVCVFCDISGFTKLSEEMARTGKGAEGVSRNINKYFQMMVKIISSGGGDVLKFAGDAMIVLWPDGDDEKISVRLHRATQCAVYIQQKLDQATIEDSVQLSVKIGIGVGMVSVIHIGGTHKRMEYLAVGDPLIQAFHAEHHAISGQVMCSPQVWKLLQDAGFACEKEFEDGFVSIDVQAEFKPVRQRRLKPILNDEDEDDHPLLEQAIKGYVPNSVLPMLLRGSYEDDMKWANETRRVAVMFVNLGLQEHNLLAAGDVRQRDAMEQVHNVLVGVQKAVYHYEGSVNKFLMDDKGSTLIACFGLSPVSHHNDALRAVLSALYICERLFDLSFPASVGITVGDVFCGVVGSTTRREYTVLGDSVNLAARLMQKSCTLTESGRPTGGIIVDEVCRNECRGQLEFQRLEPIHVKGKADKIKIFHPYPQDFAKEQLKAPMHSLQTVPRNMFREMHLQQLRIVQVHRALEMTSLRGEGGGGANGLGAVMQSPQQSKSLSPSPGMEDDGSSAPRPDLPGGNSSTIMMPKRMTAANKQSSSFFMSKMRGSVFSSSSTVGRERKSSITKMSNMLRSGFTTSNGSTVGSGGRLLEDVTALGGASLGFRISSRDRRRSSTGVGLGMVLPPRRLSKASAVAPTMAMLVVVASGSILIEAGDDDNAASDWTVASIKQQKQQQQQQPPPSPSPSPSPPPPPQQQQQMLVGDNSTLAPTTLSPIRLRRDAKGESGAQDMVSLLAAAHEQSQRKGLLRGAVNPATVATEDAERMRLDPRSYLLHIAGTRNFLPRSADCALDSKWLPTLVSHARVWLENPEGMSLAAPHNFDESPSSSSSVAAETADTAVQFQIVHESFALNVQSRVAVARQTLLERQLMLMDHKRGSVLALEGDPGIGKTYLLSHFCGKTIGNGLCQQPAIFVTSAVPFHQRPFGTWCSPLMQFVDYVAAMTFNMENGRSESEDPTNKRSSVQALRTTMCLSLLPPEIRPLAHLLNDLIGIDCEGADRDAALSPGEVTAVGTGTVPPPLGPEVPPRMHQTAPHRLQRRQSNDKKTLRVLFHLVKALSEKCSAIIVIDDAHSMDADSWSLAHAIASNGAALGIEDAMASTSSPSSMRCLPLLLVAAMRPVALFKTTYKRLPPDYEALMQLTSVKSLKMDGLPPEEVEVMVRHKLGPRVASIGDRLFSVVEELCLGNPIAILDVVEKLKNASPPVVVYSEVSSVRGAKYQQAGRDDFHRDLAMGSILEDGSNAEAEETTPTKSAAGGGEAGAYLEQAQHQTTDELMQHCELADGVTVIDERLTIPGSRLSKFFTEILDKCSPQQKMLLKTASSVITYEHRHFEEAKMDVDLNATFKLSFVENCHPVEAHKAQLQEDVEALVRCGMLVDDLSQSMNKVQHGSYAGAFGATMTKGGGEDGERTLRFAHGILLVKHLQMMMLKGQGVELLNRVKKFKNELLVKQRMEYMRKAQAAFGGGSIELKKGALRIRKVEEAQVAALQSLKRYVEGGDWKERYCVLKGSKLFMYRKESDYNASSAHSSTAHTQSIDLLGGDTELEPYEVYDRHSFRVEARNYQKDGKEIADSRPFIFSSALDPEKHQIEMLKRDVDDWHYFFKFAIEHTNMKAEQDPVAEAKQLKLKQQQQQQQQQRQQQRRGMNNMPSAGEVSIGERTSSTLKELRMGRAEELRKKQSMRALARAANDIDAVLPVEDLEQQLSPHNSRGRSSRDLSKAGLASVLLARRVAQSRGAQEDSELQFEEDDNAVDSRLLLHIEGLSGLVNRNVHGLCNPFCRIVLDARTFDTRVHGDATTSPVFRKDYVLPVNISQWGRSALRIEIWNREPFVTDDFLGQVVLPLKSMVPENWDEDAVIENLKSFPLAPRHCDNSASGAVYGHMQLGVRLIMSPSTMRRAKAQGGAIALQKQVVAKQNWKGAFAAALRAKQMSEGKDTSSSAAASSSAALPREDGAGKGDKDVKSAGHHDPLRSRLVSEVGIVSDGRSRPRYSLKGDSQDLASSVAAREAAMSSVSVMKAIDTVNKRLCSALLAVESHALTTLPAPGTKGIDRKWAHGELSHAARMLNTIVAATLRRKGSVSNIDFASLEDPAVANLLLSSLEEDQDNNFASYSHSPASSSSPPSSSKSLPSAPLSDGESVDRRESSVLVARSVQDIVDHIDLDEEQQDWLNSQYSQGDLPARTGSKDTSSSSSSSSSVSLPAARRNTARKNSTTSGKLPSSGNGTVRVDTEASVFWLAMPDLLDVDTRHLHDDATRNKAILVGPLNAHQLAAAADAGYLSGGECRIHHATSMTDAAPALPSASGSNAKWEEVGIVLPAIRAAVGDVFDKAAAEWIASPLSPVEAEAFGEWSFDLWATVEANAPNASPVLDRIVLEMFRGLGLVQRFDLDEAVIQRFLLRVDMAMSMRGNSYHNRFHSFDVAQSVYVIVTRMSCSLYLGPLEQFALLVAAICHDLEHPGQNNAFAVNAGTPLALRYNDVSPLENHHIAVAWNIMRSPGCELLMPLPEDLYKQFRKLMITSILATDMTCHFSLKEDLDGVILRNQEVLDRVQAGGQSAQNETSLASDLDRTILLKTVLHVADISNPCKPWAVSKIWSDRVLEEFFAQGDAEEHLKLTPTPNMHRSTTKQSELSVNFVDFIVGPFFMALTNLLPKVSECCELMLENRTEWHRRIMTEYEENRSMNAEKKDEEVTKWVRREAAFNDVVRPLIEQAKSKSGTDPTTMSHSSTGTKVNRSSTLRVFEDMAERTQKPSFGQTKHKK